VVAHSPAATQQYIGSPSITILPDGSYAASHDLFGPGSTKDVSRVFRSRDSGRSWKQCAELKGQWWSKLFFHGGALYIFGFSKENGSVVIRRSRDYGSTWTSPDDPDSGLLRDDGPYHGSSTPVIIHNGRIWRALEDCMGPAGWGRQFRARMFSAPVDADLLKRDSWTVSQPLGRDASWLQGDFGGWLEGNPVVDRDGSMRNVMRVDYRKGAEKAALLRCSADGKTLSFDPERDFVDFPGGGKKFNILWDTASAQYWSLSNIVLPRHAGGNPERTRNAQALLRSPDLRKWEVRAVVLYHPDTQTHGFQYVDWAVDGRDMIAMCRTAFDEPAGQAHNQHDANYLTFHRITDFRNCTLRLDRD
jgi:hypothetical protein